MKKVFLSLFCGLMLVMNASHSLANVPGGGTGSGANVTVTDNGTTVVIANGIISATITKSSATITNYSFNGYNMLTGGYNSGQIYWSWNMPNYQNPSGCTYTLTANPTSNSGNYAEVQLHMVWNGNSSTAAMDVDVYYSLTRGAQGIYATAMLTHPNTYPANPGGEWRMASYVGSTFDWLSVDTLRNRKMASLSDWNGASTVTGAPAEVKLLNAGIYANQYECKYDYSADFGDIDVWGWSSTTKNLGIWVTAPSKEYYNGGPMKRELMCHNSPTMLNMLNGEHYGMGGDLDMAAGETWQKVYGPFLLYCNSVPLGTTSAWSALWADAQAQAKAEQTAWPYTWLTSNSYIKESGRGTVTGTLTITDTTPTAPTAANMWVGVAITPSSTTNITDFQMWSKNYQFWVKTDSDGHFTIPHVIAGVYNFYTFGPGAAGQLSKLNFVTVTGGGTTNLGTVNWVPTRTAPTIWEIGIPDRSAKEFKHGTDWWTSNTYPNTHWAKFMDYPNEFPSDVIYNVGQSRYDTGWNFVQNYDNTVQTATPEWKMRFNLTTNPTAGTNSAAIYTAFAGAYSSAIIVKVNGTLITSSTGTYPPNQSDAKVRKGIHGAFGDLRFTFNGNLLHSGANEISFSIRNTGGATVGDIMYDYVRLEAAGTVLSNPLPVSFLPLTVAKQNKTSVLHWATLTEQNNNYFEVQRAADGKNFTAIGRVASRGNSNVKVDYDLVDNNPLPTVNYYRILQVDKNGKLSFSNIVSINFREGTSAFSIYPNPATDNITLDFAAIGKQTANCIITNSKGEKVRSFSINTENGRNQVLTSLLGLAAGNYNVTIHSNTLNISSRFVKL